MSIYINKSWWQDCYQTTKCVILRWEIWLMLYSDRDKIAIAKIDQLISQEQYRHPGKPEAWYLEKIVHDIRRRISF